MAERRDGDDDGFLRRWSRRKALARREGEDGPRRHGGAAPAVEATREDEAPPRRDADAPPGPAPGPEARRDSSPQATGAAPAAAPPAPDLPDIEGLGPDSDFTPFMREGVPEELRTLALRRLWRSSPTLANLDGLVDYGEDFTNAGTVVKGMRTAYRVGRGMLRDPDATLGRPVPGGAGKPAADEAVVAGARDDAVAEASADAAPVPEREDPKAADGATPGPSPDRDDGTTG